MSTDETVLIVGGGPVGLTAALALADHGVRVKVFESLAELPEDPRASTFHPPTLEFFDRFGITARLIAQGQICPDWQIRWHPTGERAVFDLSVLQDETRHPYRLQCEQWRLAREVFAQLQNSPRAQVALGAEATALEQTDRGVELTVMREGREERVSGAYVIGADGAHSVVRKAIGLHLEGDTYPETVLIAETVFAFQAHLEGLSFSTYCWRDDGNFSLLGLAGDRWRVGIYPLEGMSVEEQLGGEHRGVPPGDRVPRRAVSDNHQARLPRAQPNCAALSFRPRVSGGRCRASQQPHRRDGPERRAA